MADNSSQSNSSSFLTSFVGVLVTVLVFVLLVFLAYGFSGDKPVQAPRAFPNAPSGSSLKAIDAAVLNSYGWVDQEKGIVRIPVDRAKDLVIQELNN